MEEEEEVVKREKDYKGNVRRDLQKQEKEEEKEKEEEE